MVYSGKIEGELQFSREDWDISGRITVLEVYRYLMQNSGYGFLIGSNNWGKQRVKLSQAYQDLVNKRDDVLHKLLKWYVEEFDLISVEDVDSKELSESGFGGLIREQAYTKIIKNKYEIHEKRKHANREHFFPFFLCLYPVHPYNTYLS